MKFSEVVVKMLSELRNKKGLTQRQLAKIIGISDAAIALYETNKRVPSLGVAKRIADYFGVSIEEVFFGKGANSTKVNELTGTEGI